MPNCPERVIPREAVAAAAPLAESHPAPTPAHTVAPEALLARLETDPAHGLSEAEAAKRLARDGANGFPKPRGKSPLLQIVSSSPTPSSSRCSSRPSSPSWTA